MALQLYPQSALFAIFFPPLRLAHPPTHTTINLGAAYSSPESLPVRSITSAAAGVPALRLGPPPLLGGATGQLPPPAAAPQKLNSWAAGAGAELPAGLLSQVLCRLPAALLAQLCRLVSPPCASVAACWACGWATLPAPAMAAPRFGKELVASVVPHFR